jgi:opacity protein-like surface antigen
MIVCNVNNSISHPPHPRRAVPANLPPGAFFILMGAVYKQTLLFSALFLGTFIFADDSGSLSLSEKIAQLRLKSNAHGKYVNELLAEPITLQSFDEINEPSLINIEPVVGTEDSSVLPEDRLPLIDMPEPISDVKPTVDGVEENPSPSPLPVTEVVEEELDLYKEVPVNPGLDPGSNRDVNPEEPPTYDELYSSKVVQRRLGYYFGPFLSAVFADGSAIKNPSRIPYHSKGGVATGLRVGNDFGNTRIEGEYAYLTHKISGLSGATGRTNLHNFQSRLILEKSLGDRADLRLGIGLGIAFVNKELEGHKYDGVSFSYDFLLGWSYRVIENWSLGLDYKHYLTSAHKNYDRLQGHMIELSVGFDL